MKKHSAFVVKFLKQYEHKCPGITDSWYAKDVQEKFNSFKSKKCCAHECTPSDGSSTQKPTCFILFCIDRRKELQEQNPHVPNKQITSMLAKEWKEHKRLAQEDTTSNDNIYNKYKKRYEKMVFFDKHKNTVKEKYPELDDQELEMTLEKLYIKYIK
jgi:hypothetical protein